MPNYNGYGGYSNNPLIYGAQHQSYQTFSPYQQSVQPQMQQQAQQPVQASQQPVQQQTPTRSNKVFVTSIEDATGRYADPNTEIIYLHQDKPFIFEVFTDWQGKKTVKTYRFEECTVEEMQDETKGIAKKDLENFVTKNDLTEFKKSLITSEDLEALEGRIVQFVKQCTYPQKVKQMEIPVE